MGELMIRRNRGFTVPQYQSVGKGEKAAASTGSTKTSGGTGLSVSETLRELMGRVSQAENRTRESRGILQKGEAVLDEVQERLGRIAQLVRESAEGDPPDRAALQAELEQLREDIERMLTGAAVNGVPLFLDEDLDLEDGAKALLYTVMGELSPLPEEIQDVPDWVKQLLEKVEGGLTPDQAIKEMTNGEFTSLEDYLNSVDNISPELKQFLTELLLTGGDFTALAGSPLMSLLAGLEGINLELLMGLLTVSQGEQEALALELAPESGAAGTEGSVQETAAQPGATLQFGQTQVTGQDLSGVSFNPSTGQLTVSGTADVTIQGMGQEEQSILITGSGKVTLQHVNAPSLTVDTDAARLVSAGDHNTLGQVELREGASLTVDGSAPLTIGALRGGSTNTLRLTGGAVTVAQEKDDTSQPLTVPIVLEGATSLAVQAASVSDASGRTLEPFDLIWKALLPGWSSIASMEVDGRQTKTALMNGDPVRLWLSKGEHGYPVHGLIIQGKDASGRPQTRYAYLRWNQQSRSFQEVSMYPNPFEITGGQPGQDWVYEEESHTLRILSNQVTAVSGGAGTDINQEPFSGRIALSDGIGTVELALEGVVCRVEEGRAFDLGRGNDVILLLQSGTSTLFESGPGCAGISLGDGTTLCIDCVRPQDGGEADGILTATGGAGSAGIGWDNAGKGGQTGHILIRGGAGVGGGARGFMGSVTIIGGMVASTGGKGGGENMGISLQVGEDSMTLPQFRLSARTLRLDRLSVLTRQYAQAAQAAVEADRRWVSRVQEAYGALYGQLEQSYGALPNVCRYLDEKKRLLRDTDSASTLLEDMRRSLLDQPVQAMRTHNRRGTEDIGQLLR